MEKIELKKAIVRQYVSRIAKTGRKMWSVEVYFGDFIILKTLWGDMPYPLKKRELRMIESFATSLYRAGYSYEDIHNALATKYYEGFNPRQNISDFERFQIRRERAERKPARNFMLNIYMRPSLDRGTYGRNHTFHITRLIDGEYVSSPVNTPKNSIANLRVGDSSWLNKPVQVSYEGEKACVLKPYRR